MATDLERPVIQLEASLTKYERELRKASGTADRTARDIERRFQGMERKLSAVGGNLRGVLGAIGLGLSAQQVQAELNSSRGSGSRRAL